MSIMADSPVHSSSSSSDDDFAAFLDLELDRDSDDPPTIEGEVEEGGEKEKGKQQQKEEYEGLDLERSKRQKVESIESSTCVAVETQTSATSLDMNICDHPAVWNNLCVRCGQRKEDESGVSFGYIHKNLRLAPEEVDRLREKDLKYLLSQKKLYLVLDLDHTLLNSSLLKDLNEEEAAYLNSLEDGPTDAVKNGLHRLDRIGMVTKLRPFVHTFLEEASKLFEMYIYTMGDRKYALAMADLLDPKCIYFQERVIANVNSTKRYQKGLDVVLGKESAVLILDDTEKVWEGHLGNLILMDRYHFFPSSLRQFQLHSQQSLSERKSDENESDGALATVLSILKKAHGDFFDEKQKEILENRDVRQVIHQGPYIAFLICVQALANIRKEVLKGCKIVFSRVFPRAPRPENQDYWKLAEQLGAICAAEVDSSITHVISRDAGTEKSHWAVRKKKFLVNPSWLDAARYLWKRQPEASYPVSNFNSRNV